MIRTLLFAAVAAFAALSTFAQERVSPEARPALVTPNADDVARALERFDRAWTRNPPPSERVAEINRRFDRALTALRATPVPKRVDDSRRSTSSPKEKGAHDAAIGEALRAIDDLACELDVALPRDLLNLRAEFDPPVGTLGTPSGPGGSPLRVRVVQLYPYRSLEGDASVSPPRTLLFQLISPFETNKVVAEVRRTTRELADGALEFETRLDDVAGSAYVLSACSHERNGEVGFVPYSGPPYWLRLATFHVRVEPASELRARLELPSAELQPTSAAMESALATFRARLARLVDAGSDARDTFTHDPAVALAEQLKRELAALVEGRDPYQHRHGELWRTIQVDGAALPVRVFAPDPREDARLPLVIALHARGEDEDAFFGRYGVGSLVELARERGFVLATPRLGDDGFAPEAFDALVKELADDLPIDPARIVVLGNAEGGRAAAELAFERRNRIAGSACFATEIPELRACAALRVFAGALDPILAASAVQSSVDAARGRGLPIELELVADHGHALVANARLAAAVEWLLARRLDERDAR